MRFLIFMIFEIFSLSVSPGLLAQSSMYICEDGEVRFVSNAPLEIIEATSNALKGIVDPASKKFAFSIDIISFTGFNSALQREHFRENYVEISQFSSAVFEGRLIEQINLAEAGTYKVRAKGKMSIHGRQQEIILPCQLISNENSIKVYAEFVINLADYNIVIPKVVSKKIAEDISVEVKAVLKKK